MNHTMRFEIVAATLVAGGLCACVAPSARRPAGATTASAARPQVTHGVAAGDVTSTSAVIWSRCDREGRLHVALQERPDGPEIAVSTAVNGADDFTGEFKIDGLAAGTTYAYRAWCSAEDTSEPRDMAGAARREASADGSFHTAPDPHARQAVRFAWGGDLAGQNVCRDRLEGYPILRTIAEQAPDFFIGLGDMIYADNPCLAVGRYGNQQVPGPVNPATDLPGFWAYWKYNRDDDALRRLLATVPYYAVWDDHEVINDFGPQHDTGWEPPYPAGRHLMPLGLKAFLDYNPIDAGTEKRLYRPIRWGRHLEVFVLDTRQYRDANFATDDAAHPKTMLGLEQRAWLTESLRQSDATWKVIVSSVPLSIPTGVAERGRDGWANYDQATGFENELLDILRFLQAHRITNTVWISTDIHFASVFRDTPFRDDPAFRVYEVDTGPLNAGVFPKPEFDRTLNPERLFLYPDRNDNAAFEEAKSWFNFGVIGIDATGALKIEIINTHGVKLYTLPLRPH